MLEETPFKKITCNRYLYDGLYTKYPMNFLHILSILLIANSCVINIDLLLLGPLYPQTANLFGYMIRTSRMLKVSPVSTITYKNSLIISIVKTSLQTFFRNIISELNSSLHIMFGVLCKATFSPGFAKDIMLTCSREVRDPFFNSDQIQGGQFLTISTSPRERTKTWTHRKPVFEKCIQVLDIDNIFWNILIGSGRGTKT